MYCSNCGKSDQMPDSYCRSCGEYLSDPKSGNAIAFGGNTPEQNVNSINILSILAAVASLFAALWMYASQFTVPVALYFGAALLLCNAFWHLSNFYVGMKLKKRLGTNKVLGGINDSLPEARTVELLKEMDEKDIIPASVTENTTRHLNEKLKS